MDTRLRYFAVYLGVVSFTLAIPAYSQCTKDVDCKGDRVCVKGTCVDPAGSSVSRKTKPLSRSRASQLIAAQQRLPRPQTVALASRYLKRSWSKPVVGFGKVTVCVHEGDKYADVEQRLKYYQSQGMITIGFETVQGECPGLWATVNLTEAGKEYAAPDATGMRQVRLWTLAMGDVTGIQANEQFQIAETDYNLKLVDLTPFGAHVRATSVAEKATFRLFDDGWRIEPSKFNFGPVSYRDLPVTPALQEASRAVAAAEAAEEAASGSHRSSTATPTNAVAAGVPRKAGSEADTSVPWPRPETQVPASYPEVARKAGIKGVVIVRCSVSEQGDVVSTEVIKGLPFGLDAAAVAAVHTWKFRPALKNGKPIAATYDAVVDF